MKHDLLAYRSELQRKLDAVNSVIADMGVSVPSPALIPSTNPKVKRKISAAGRARIAAAARARWKRVKAAGKNRL
jgi:hypothetical protein